MPRTLVVTGAAGMVGQSLVPRLIGRGDEVIALDKHSRHLGLLVERAPGVKASVVDLAEPGPWERALAAADAVIDLKAEITAPGPGPQLRNNVEATHRVLEACQRQAVPHLIFLSSSVVISVADDFYTRTKREAEAAVVRSQVPHTVLRPPLMYGAGDVKHLGRVLGLMERLPLLPIPGHGCYVRQPLYAGDLCSVILAALEKGPSGSVHNVIGHERITFIELLRRIRALSGVRCLLLPVPIPLFRLALGVWSWLTCRPGFTREQLKALTAGDVFPVEDWTGSFGVPFTPFDDAAPSVYGSSPDELRRRMMRLL